MSLSLYYGRSPYLQNRGNKKVSRRKSTIRHTSPGVGMFMKRLPTFQRRARRSIVFGAQQGSAAVKGSAQMIAGAINAAKKISPTKIRWEFGPGTVMAGMMVVAIGLSFAYLAYFNQVATRGYEMTKLEADRQQLVTQYEIKNMKLAEVRSLNYIAKSDRVSNMRKPGNVEFVRGSTAIALK